MVSIHNVWHQIKTICVQGDKTMVLKQKQKKQRERELRSKGNIPTGNPKSWA